MSEDNTRNSFPGSAVDYHIHIGQFYDEYYQPSAVIRALGICGVKDAWVSSSGSFASWNNEQEKSHVLRYIESEIEEALLARAGACRFAGLSAGRSIPPITSSL